VIIDRIPFPRPDDPVMSARARAVDAAGGSGFSAVTLAKAGLLLAQASGRLIRSSTDRGVVSVLDSRLATARYGAGLRASMPPLWFTTNKDSTLSALQRLAKEAKESKAP
jgi:ATP-dependent DNA helicase DinG